MLTVYPEVQQSAMKEQGTNMHPYCFLSLKSNVTLVSNKVSLIRKTTLPYITHILISYD
jgi:hypothetical protein